MRLICPRCGAQYEIDGAAIPPGGRDVECSACDHVWRALPPPGSFNPAARPQLSRPLSDSVIEILREEAARELEVRDAERRLQRAAERTAALAEPASEDRSGEGDAAPAEEAVPAPDAEPMARGGTAAREDGGAAQALPAALVHDAGADPLDSPPPPRMRSRTNDARSSLPDHDDPGAAADDPEGPGGAMANPAPKAEVMPPVRQPDAAAPSIPPAPHLPRRQGTRSRRYDAGFRVAVIVALAAVALYALAPRMGDAGPLGATLAAWRSEVDQGRDWLARQGDAAVGRLRRAAGGD